MSLGMSEWGCFRKPRLLGCRAGWSDMEETRDECIEDGGQVHGASGNPGVKICAFMWVREHACPEVDQVTIRVLRRVPATLELLQLCLNHSALPLVRPVLALLGIDDHLLRDGSETYHISATGANTARRTTGITTCFHQGSRTATTQVFPSLPREC